MRTWQFELLVVTGILASVTFFTGNQPVDWLATLAVATSFAHGQITDRLAEREAARPVASVECYELARLYFFVKEILWCCVFVLHHTWPALVGAGLFLVYPFWRKWWRSKYPINNS